MNNFWQRTLTGAIYVIAILVSIFYQEEYFTLTALFSVIYTLALYEFYKIINLNKGIHIPIVASIITSLFLYAGCIQLAFRETGTLIFVYAILLICLLLSELYRKKPYPIHNAAFILLGQCFIVLPFSLLNFIAVPDNTQFVLALFCFIWLSDTGAYLSGKFFGKHKLFERISPKKTWEGFIGGALFVVLASLIFWYYNQEYPLWQWIIYGLLVTILGVYGDLLESLLKRSVNIKDSGTLLPGHGGMLDRIDSLLLTIPVIYLYLMLLKELAS
jgi:phosphatidate cytidylyltransferase